MWIAFKLVSLFHYEQHKGKIFSTNVVVNCFQISIFVPLRTANNSCRCSYFPLWIAFKLVSLFHYEQQAVLHQFQDSVVNCFQISIFVPLRTANNIANTFKTMLWIAFKLVSLFHYEQLFRDILLRYTGCELLSN